VEHYRTKITADLENLARRLRFLKTPPEQGC